MLDALPTKYYLDHARELFSFVSKECAHLLHNEHKHYLNNIESLSEESQCLLIRCLARKPRFIKRISLNYAEITSTERSLIELQAKQYLRCCDEHDWLLLVNQLTKPQLIKCLEHAPVKIKSSTLKDELIKHAKRYLRGDEDHLASMLKEYIVRQQSDVIDYVFFLFFGDLRNRFQQFVMRDLGVIKTRKAANVVARFNNQAEALSAFEMQRCRGNFLLNPKELKESVADYLINTPAVGHSAEETRARLLLSVGNEYLDHDVDKAISLWKASSEPKAIEKWIRESYKHGDKNALKQQLLGMRDAEMAPSTKVFVEDFYARKYQGKRTSLYTDMLRETARTLDIDEAFISDVEAGVIAYYEDNNIDAYFSENSFWRVLFALTFWELLFGQEQAQFSEFDKLPNQLKQNNFYQLQEKRIEACLDEFNYPASLLEKLTQRSVTHFGKPTGLFRWSPNILAPIRAALKCDNANLLANVLRRMALNYAHAKDGYPDIMIIEQNTLRFEEVKAPGDVLRPNQLVSINRLRSAGIDVDITHVNWASNPNQIYAVVDIETTGSSKGGNAITEIAVVQVQNNEIISEWATLVNPRRHIPAHITRLTGIDNAMVANAPIFAEIADQLEHQLNGAIFVAHNVGFDYGFIKAAYESINRSFRKPKFCTVSNSRKTFPGLKSYSLGALTDYFDIDLDNHHRALSDAKATANLLRLIQDTRQQTKRV